MISILKIRRLRFRVERLIVKGPLVNTRLEDITQGLTPIIPNWFKIKFW